MLMSTLTMVSYLLVASSERDDSNMEADFSMHCSGWRYLGHDTGASEQECSVRDVRCDQPVQFDRP